MSKTVCAHHPDLSGCGVLITGGASGIGAALVEGFARQGARVAFIDIDASAAQALVERLSPGLAHPPLFLQADLRDTVRLHACVRQAAELLGGLRVLVNNAARDDRHDLETMEEADWDEALAINLKPLLFTAKAAAPYLQASGAGAIVNFSSIAYLLNMGELPAYSAAKAGIIGLTKSLAGRLGPKGIRVNALLPGMVVTERQKALWLTDGAIAAMIDRQCIKRSLVADDMVGPCLFLASQGAAALTAQAIIVDGGVL
ncbi:3-oxoacyl-ACP reductase [Rhizobium rhizosphaerae]|uniref:3-oxoacyl-ACP reductase n=1 Tax=Xaviernesmea rhizosphaerae TaxID=1672749 RepID=A0ABX3PBW9_9HYPH|nr:SDR family oxidoreductase [Xaviernesmea rhizosphaerae]OQP85951.1 3-oxoacyl-ACP reductase [Xaviernesmea rhizosphaerae]